MLNSYAKAVFRRLRHEYRLAQAGCSLNLCEAVIDRLALLSGTYSDEDRKLVNSLLYEALCYPPGGGKERFRHYLAVYELYKKIITVPGHIVEIGVWRGYTTVLFAYLLQLFGDVGDEQRRHIYGFDTFEGYLEEDMLSEADPSNPILDTDYGDTSLEYVKSMIASIGASSFVHFIKGDVAQTLPAFLDTHRDFKVALLVNDCNLYAPSRAALQLLIPRMQPGGIIYLDSYNNPYQFGATRAADEVLSQFGLVLQRDVPPLSQPAYCVIPRTGVVWPIMDSAPGDPSQ